ncbi:MAG: hypothetical protein CSA97_01135 [Bacteroidetes bacterium]|nr:MAG: hypothetical protein CSA97_01135 [Bacteroidota bacterium]
MRYRSHALSPFRQLLVLGIFLLGAISLAVFALILLRAMGLYGSDSPVVNLLIQAFYTLCIFLVPALLWAYVARKQEYRPFSLALPPWPIGTVALLLPLLAMPAVELLTDINHLIPASDWLTSLEARVEQSTLKMLYIESPQRFILNICVVALIPAIAEEFFFRGALQHILVRFIRRPHYAIWLTAIIFALVHMQLLSLLPRILLGAVLGYIYYYSQTLVSSIAYHFANNLLAVVAYFYAAKNGIAPERLQEMSIHWILGLVSLAAILGAMYLVRKVARRR